MKEVLCVDASGVQGITESRQYWVERETHDQYIIYNDIQQAGGYLSTDLLTCTRRPRPLTKPPEMAEDRFREALERIAKLTPRAANASAEQDLHLTVKAIAESALSDHPTN